MSLKLNLLKHTSFYQFRLFENNKFLEDLSKSKDENFYGERQQYTDLETLGKIKPKASGKIILTITKNEIDEIINKFEIALELTMKKII